MTKTPDTTRNLTLTLRRTWEDGGAAYVIEGLDGTIYVEKGILAGDAPQTLTLSGSGLADPVTAVAEKKAKADARAKADAERKAKEDAAARVEQPAARVAQTATPVRKSGRKAA